VNFALQNLQFTILVLFFLNHSKSGFLYFLVPSPPFIDYFASTATDHSINVWDSNNGSLIFNLTGHKSEIGELRKLNNNSVLSGSRDGVFKIWNMSSGSLIRTLDCSSNNTDVKFGLLPNGYIVGKCGDKMLNIWNLPDGKLVRNFNVNNHYDIVTLIVLSNGYIATGTWFAQIQILNPMTGSLITKSSASVTSLILIQLPNGNIANGDWDHTIKIFNTTTGKLVFNLVGHTGPVNSFELLSNGYLASASCYNDDNARYYGGDKRILIWDPNHGSLVQTLTGHIDFVTRLKLLNNGYLASGANKDTIKIWNPNSNSLIHTLAGHTGPIFEFLLLSNGNLASRSDDKTIKVWNITTGSLVYTINGNVYSGWGVYNVKLLI
jgi:WD40 repeat protein